MCKDCISTCIITINSTRSSSRDSLIILFIHGYNNSKLFTVSFVFLRLHLQTKHRAEVSTSWWSSIISKFSILGKLTMFSAFFGTTGCFLDIIWKFKSSSESRSSTVVKSCSLSAKFSFRCTTSGSFDLFGWIILTLC